MAYQQEAALESSQQAAAIMRDVQNSVLIPGTEMLSQWEVDLGEVAILLESLHSRENGVALHGDTVIRQTLQEIKRTATTLKAQFEHGSNYCMGLLQIRLGTGYTERGLPVLIPSEATSSFEG